MPTDSQILDTMIRALASSEPEFATLRKYAPIARAVESGEWKLVDVSKLDCIELSARKPVESECTEHAAVYFYGEGWNKCRNAVLAAAPQFQEEGK
jgi:hypothetical protein